MLLEESLLIKNKVCSECLVDKPIGEFYRYEYGKYVRKVDFNNACKVCQKIKSKRCRDEAKLKNSNLIQKTELQKKTEQYYHEVVKPKLQALKLQALKDKEVKDKELQALKDEATIAYNIEIHSKEHLDSQNKRKEYAERYRQLKQLQLSLDKAKYVIEKGNKCLKCGIENLPLCLWNFHHNNPDEKIDSIRNLVGEEQRKEIDKCSLLCCHCHMLHHHKHNYTIKTATDLLEEYKGAMLQIKIDKL